MLRNLEELNCEGLEGESGSSLQPLALAQGLTLWTSELKHHQKLHLQRGKISGVETCIRAATVITAIFPDIKLTLQPQEIAQENTRGALKALKCSLLFLLAAVTPLRAQSASCPPCHSQLRIFTLLVALQKCLKSYFLRTQFAGKEQVQQISKSVFQSQLTSEH